VAADVDEGYLVLADVSGYTGFLAGIEIDHASGIPGGRMRVRSRPAADAPETA
jgi:hypothetical protein